MILYLFLSNLGTAELIIIFLPIILIIGILTVVILNNKKQQNVIVYQQEVKNCPFCGEDVLSTAKRCIHCGEWLNSNDPATKNPISGQPVSGVSSGQRQTIIVNQMKNQSNGVGTAGFVLALISCFLSWIPGVGWILWFLGAFLSFIGMFKSPRGLAVTGFIISFIGLILLLFVFGALATIFGSILYQ